MKFLIPCLLLLLPLVLFSQNESATQLIFLTDGSILKGRLVSDTLDNLVSAVLSDGSEISFSKQLLLHTQDAKDDYLILPDGRRVTGKRRFSSIAVHTLNARRSTDFSDEMRWGMGAHFSTGYQFKPALALSGGIGLDVHEYFFMPVFLEISGFGIKKEFRQAWQNHSDATVKTEKPKRIVPFSYSLQIGYNVPIQELFSGENAMQTGGGFMIYPAAGILIPSRLGHTFRFDIGYKIQNYSRNYSPQGWRNYRVTDSLTLKSFALRAGWIF